MLKRLAIVGGLVFVSFCSSQRFTKLTKHDGKRIDDGFARYEGTPVTQCWSACALYQNCLAVNHNDVNNVCVLIPGVPAGFPQSGPDHPDWDVYYRQISENCDEGWTRFDVSCYKFVTTANLTWTDAQANCASEGGHLVDITSEEENQFFTGQIAPFLTLGVTSFWLGGRRAAVNEAVFVWSSGIPVSYSDYAAGEPNNQNGQENCLSVFNKLGPFLWNDLPCWTRAYSTCEQRLY